jgi:hypothetical protein
LNHSFVIGKYRPIYLWAGPGTIRMNKVKFMDYPVDEEVHRAAHTAPIARLVDGQLHTNWVHLMYDWGFPPEIEVEDWEDFRTAADVYHAAGCQVFAYIQVSNCVYSGSFIEKDWYAQDPRGRRIYYYAGRYMTDWTHPEWKQHLVDRVTGALDCGADGIFFDNLWYGQHPNSLMGAWLGGAGCYCDRCRALYRSEAGQEIPEKILPERDDVAAYLRWRGQQVTNMVADLAEMIQRIKPGAPISANDYVVSLQNSFLIYGVDVEALARIQDVIMVENFALPRLDMDKARLANNALTIRNTRELVGDQTHLSVLSYDVGIGFDSVYPPRRHQQGIAEAAACGASMTVKGTEYNDGTRMTLLTDSAYAPQHQAIGNYQRWVEEHSDLFMDRTNAAPIGLLHPGEDLWRHWTALAPVYHGAGQVLTWSGIPWRVVRAGDPLDGLSAVLTFGVEAQVLGQQVPHIHVPALPGWAWRKTSLVARGGFWHTLIEVAADFLIRAYHGSKTTRLVMDKLNMAKLVTGTPLFTLPEQSVREALLAALPDQILPRVEAEKPVLIDIWEQAGERQVHLVNYADHPQTVRVHLGSSAGARVISPDRTGETTLKGDVANLDLDIYAVLVLE